MGGWNPLLCPDVYDGNAHGFMDMGITAENLAEQYKIARAAQEKFALNSHQKAAKSQADGLFKDEIISIDGLDYDDCVRADTTLEQMAKLKPAFAKDGSVTAATSSPVTDGASAMLITSEAYAQKHKLAIRAKLGRFTSVGCAPETMGIAPARTIIKLLQQTGLSIDDIDLFEINGAFAAQCLSVLHELKDQGLAIPEEKFNVRGGAIAIGHPLGASGIRIVGNAANTLQAHGGGRAIASMCVGGGQGTAILIES